MTVLSVILSAALSWYITVPERIPSWLLIRRKSILKGEWYVAWFPKHPNEKDWETDKTEFKHRFGKLNFIVESKEYRWKSSLVFKGKYFLGEWWSLKPHSSSRGTLQLKFNNQGDVLLGKGTGPHEDDRFTSYNFVLSQNINKLNEAIQNFDEII